MKVLVNVKKYWVIVLLIIVGCVPLIDLFHIGFPLTHDGQDHIARIANFYRNLQEGILVPRWAAELNWGYGHPILMFLYPIPSYITSLIHFLGFSLIDSFKIIFGLTFIASGLTMYLWIKSFLNKEVGFIAAILYMFAPYRFMDFYVRGAIGEHVAFVFPPLIFYFLLMSAKKNSYWYMVGGALSLAGLILSHNAISLMFLPIIILYSVYLYFQTKIKKKFLISVGIIIFFGFSLSAFFWIPALLEGKYTLRDKIIAGGYRTRFVPFLNLFRDPEVYDGNIPFSMQVGVIQWLIILLSPIIIFYFYKKKNLLWIMIVGLLTIFIVSVFLIIEPSRVIWQNIQLLQNFQFPWRFLSVTLFATAVLGAIVCYQLPKKFITIGIVCITLVTFFLTQSLWHAKAYMVKPETFFTNIYYGTTDTGESAPMWSVRFMEHTPKAAIEVIEGKAIVTTGKRTSTQHVYTIQSAEAVRIVENTLFFPGWEVKVDGQPVLLQFQEAKYRGLMTFFVPAGQHRVTVLFRDTKLRMIANVITFFSICILIIFGIYSHIYTKRVVKNKQ